MKKTLAIALLICAAASLGAAETTRYIVGTRPGAGTMALKAFRDSAADPAEREVRTFASVDAFAIDLTEAEARELRRSSHVRFVDPVVPRSIASAGPVGELETAAQTVPWGLEYIKAPSVWPYTRGAGIHVAVIDTGIDPTHPELKDRIAGGFNVLTNTENFADDQRHGTHVAGTIAAKDDDIGVVGVAPEVTLWAVKALNEKGTGTDENVAAAIDWVIRKKKEIGGRWIISMSLGATQQSEIERETVRRAIDDGILLVAAAGNTGLGAVHYPGGYPDVVSVGSIDPDEEKSGFSSFGPRLVMVAPGRDVISTVPLGFYSEARVDASGKKWDAASVIGSPKGTLEGRFVDCGLGRPGDFPLDATGNICIVRRGEILFREKGRNARAAGANAMVLVNNTDSDWSGWTLTPPVCDDKGSCAPLPEDVAFDWPLTVAVAKDTGEALLKGTGPLKIDYSDKYYQSLNGTSMACPHVSGSAALLWALAPNATAADVRFALRYTARDLGEPFWDLRFGWGSLDALAAAKYLAPTVFGLPPNPAPVRVRRPSTGR